MATVPDPPAADDDEASGLETTLEFEQDPATLVEEIRKAKEQDACLIIVRGKPRVTILLPNTNGETAFALAERMRAAVAAHAFVYEEERLPVTCSIGVATLGAGIDTAAALLKAADKAGYSSKQNGRNRVTIAG